MGLGHCLCSSSSTAPAALDTRLAEPAGGLARSLTHHARVLAAVFGGSLPHHTLLTLRAVVGCLLSA